MMILVIGIGLLVLALLGFIGYSYMQNQRSKYVSNMYREFKEQYRDTAKTALGYAQTNFFSKPIVLMLAVGRDYRVEPIVLMLAVGRDYRVVDAWSVTDREMELEGRVCEEYIGMDLKKYVDHEKEKKEQDLLMRNALEPKNSKECAFDMAVGQILNQLTGK